MNEQRNKSFLKKKINKKKGETYYTFYITEYFSRLFYGTDYYDIP